MAPELRKTGISVVGDVPWGTYFCHFYETKQDLLDTLVPYFKAGLESREFCVWVVSDSQLITVEEAKGALKEAVPDLDRHLSNEDIEILKGLDWYLEENVFNLERVTKAWDAKLKRALARGYDGMRVSGDTFWLTEKDWKDFFAYEKQLNDSITDQPMTVLCTYPLAKSGAAEVLDVVHVHQFAIARRQGEWEIIETPELIQTKAEIRRLNEQLEQRVVERTHELVAANEALKNEIAERRRIEEELRARAADLTEAQRVTKMGNWIFDVRTNKVNWSDQLYRIFGIEARDFDGRYESFVSRIHPDDRPLVLRTNAQTRIEGSPFDIEYRIIAPNDEVRVIREVGYAAQDEAGNVIRLFGTAQDITDRKLVELALDERLLFETLLTELSAAFANLPTNEVDHEIEKWLQSLVEFLGVDRASFFQFGEDWTTLYRSHSYTVSGIEPLPPPPIGMKEQFSWITTQLSQGVTVKWSRIPDDMPQEAAKEREYAARLGAKSSLNIPVAMGGSIICAITFTSIATYHDWPDVMVARLRLVGEIFAAAVERKRAEAALRKSEEQFRQMAENIREVFWLTTADLSKMLYISPAYEVVWGQSRESLYREPRSFSAAIHTEDRSRVIAIVERDREKGFEVEYRVVRPDGSIRWIQDRGFPIKDESGHFYRVAGIAADITERKEAEDALRRSEDRLRLVIDTIPVMAWSIQPDGVVDFLNQGWMDYFGLSLQQYVADPTGPVHPEDLPRVVEKWRRNMLAGESNEDEIRLRRADGEYRWFLVRNAPLRDTQGNVVRWYGVSIDIEDRKQAEEKLKHNEVQLAQAQRLAHVGSWDWDLRTNKVTWSEELYRIFGLEPGKIMVVGDAMSFIHPDDHELVRNTVNRAVSNKERYSFYYRALRPDGRERIVHSRGAILTDDHGEPIRVFGATQDVTELKQAEEKLKQSERQLAEAQRLAHIGSWDWDLRTNAVTWSDELYHIFGLQPGAISVAEEVDRFIHPDDLALGWDTVKRAVASKEPYDYYHRILRPDGAERIARSRGSIMSDERGEPIKVFGATQDVTELKHAEEKLKATTEQLRALSASLQSAREQESTRIARELHDELGGALTALRWDLEEVGGAISEATDSTQLSALRKRIEAMTTLTGTTLDTIRRLASELRPMALDELGLAEAIEWQALQFQTRTGIAVEYECSQEKVDLNSEQSTAVFRILQEALTNVLRHAQATQVTVTMKQEAGEFLLTIKDNGRGITESEKSGVYSLGLLGMRERAHLINADIEITGIEGKETVVAVRIPVGEPNESRDQM